MTIAAIPMTGRRLFEWFLIILFFLNKNINDFISQAVVLASIPEQDISAGKHHRLGKMFGLWQFP